MITVKNLSKTYKVPQKKPGMVSFLQGIFRPVYKEIKALEDVSFSIGEGELVGLIGPNGAGKTTTMKILSGILYPTEGDAKVLGFNPSEKKHDFLRQIGFVMGQKNQLLWDLPAIDSFILYKEIYEISDSEFDDRISEMTKLLQCADILSHPVKTLSLGQRMKMEFIGALLHRPKILFLDEPTIGLDVVAQKTIRDFIKEYQARHKATIILTSHYMEDVKLLAKRVMIINFGKIVYDGELDEVIKKYVKEKKITVILEDEPDKKILREVAREYEFDYPQVIFRVPREKLSEKVELIGKKLNYTDITIEEERIEDVIRKIFSVKHKE